VKVEEVGDSAFLMAFREQVEGQLAALLDGSVERLIGIVDLETRNRIWRDVKQRLEFENRVAPTR
jgi:hypothetical protein